jgi:hypothetical protein
MEFPKLRVNNGRYTFFYFNYGYRVSKGLDLYVDVVIKDDDLNPVCYRELFISDEGKALKEVEIFEKEFSLYPEKYRNIKATKE